MKRKILGIVLTAMLVASLALSVVPAMALSVTSVTVNPNTISAAGVYTIKFTIVGPQLNAADPDTITIQFPSGTTLPGALVAGSVTVQVEALAPVAATTVAYDNTLKTAVINVPADIPIFSDVTVVFSAASGITNPAAPGSYTLKVKTNEEDTYIESAAYTIATPGFVQRFNSAGNLVGSFNTIAAALVGAATKDVIKVAPGNYTDAVDFNVSEITVETTGSKADTTITAAVTVSATKVKVDDFTIKGTVAINAADVTVQNCDIIKASSTAAATMVTVNSTGFIFKDSTVDATSGSVADVGVSMAAGSTATLTNVAFKVDENGSLVDDKAIESAAAITSLTVDKCTFTGASGTGYYDGAGATGVTIKNSTFDTLDTAINVNNVSSVVTVQGNTFKNGSLDTAAAIDVNACTTVKIEGNTFSDNKGYSIDIADGTTVTVIGNSFSNNAKGFRNTDAANDVNAKMNWWGNVAGPTTATVTGGDKISDDVVYKPFATVATSSARSLTTDADQTTVQSLDAQSSAGVIVSGINTVAAADVLVTKYTANPKTTAPPNTPIATGYFDVYTSAASTTDVTIKLYTAGITANTRVYFWSGLTQSWVLCSSQGAAGTGEYAWVIAKPASATTPTTPNTDDLTGTIFALSNAPATTTPPATPAAPVILNPVSGTSNVSISPTFAWTAVGTPYYEFQLAKDPGFVEPIADALKLDVPYFAYGGQLEYGTVYYWQVRGSRNTGTSRCSGAECGGWAQGVFTTMEAPPPPASPTPPVTPTQIVIPPATPAITPAWIYVIIGIGAALIIAVIVLIVTTRRAAP